MTVSGQCLMLAAVLAGWCFPALGQRVLLSGSGSTLVALYPSASAADEAARSFAAAVPDSLIGSHIIATNHHGPEWRTYP